MLTPTVRPATPTDAPALAHIQVTSYRYAPHFPPGFWDGVTKGEQCGNWLSWTREHPEDVLLVARAPGDTVGYVLARSHPSHGAEGEMMALHVLPGDWGARSVSLSTPGGTPFVRGLRRWVGGRSPHHVRTRTGGRRPGRC